MKHTSILLAAAMCALAASSTFTPALAQEIRTLEVATIGKVDSTGRRLRIIRLYTRRLAPAQSGAEGAFMLGDGDRSCRRHQERAHTPMNRGHNRIPLDDRTRCRLITPEV